MSTRWKGTIAVEGHLDRDGARLIEPGAIHFEFLPVPLLRPPFTEEVAGVEVHRPSTPCGEVELIQRDAEMGHLVGTGWIEDDVLIDLLSTSAFPNAALGVGVDLDQMTAVYVDEVMTVKEARLRSLTVSEDPAFPAATVRSVA